MAKQKLDNLQAIFAKQEADQNEPEPVVRQERSSKARPVRVKLTINPLPEDFNAFHAIHAALVLSGRRIRKDELTDEMMSLLREKYGKLLSGKDGNG